MSRAVAAAVAAAALALCGVPVVVRAAFPSSFVWGTGTASYQIEGAVNQDGRVPTIWDTFSHTPGKVYQNENGDVADDSYNKWKTDIQLMSAMKGLNAFRFSIAWARIIQLDGTVNPAGIAHYNALIDGLLGAGITPWVTLYHWDLPLQYSTFNDSTHGWLDSDYIVPLFTTYADACFNAFSDRVKHWTTFNEPHSFCFSGYDTGVQAPGRCSDRAVCPEGNSVTEPYLCVHSVALAHAHAASVFRTKYQPTNGGVIGMTTDAGWAEPLTSSPEDQAASERSMLFNLGIFTDPIIFGDYPDVVKASAGALLPSFTDAEKALLKGSVDFFALNHYTSRYVGQPSYPQPSPGQGYDADMWVNTTTYDIHGTPIGPQAASSWLLITPQFFPNILSWVHARYPSLTIYITENGVDVPGEDSMPIAQALNDTYRINYLQGYLSALESSINSGIPVAGYFCWSLMDNFEWSDGYHFRFGLHYVQYNVSQTRTPKASAHWYSQLASTGVIPSPATFSYPARSGL